MQNKFGQFEEMILKKNIRCLNQPKKKRNDNNLDKEFLSAPQSPSNNNSKDKQKIPKHIQQIFDSQEKNFNIDTILRKKLGLQQKTQEFKFNEKLKDFQNLASWKNLKSVLEQNNILNDKTLKGTGTQTVIQDKLKQLHDQMGKFVQVEDEDYFYYLESQKQSAYELINQTKQQIQLRNQIRQTKPIPDEISNKLINHIQNEIDANYPQYNDLLLKEEKKDKNDEKQLQKEKIIKQIVKIEKLKTRQITKAIQKQQDQLYSQLYRTNDNFSSSMNPKISQYNNEPNTGLYKDGSPASKIFGFSNQISQLQSKQQQEQQQYQQQQQQSRQQYQANGSNRIDNDNGNNCNITNNVDSFNGDPNFSSSCNNMNSLSQSLINNQENPHNKLNLNVLNANYKNLKLQNKNNALSNQYFKYYQRKTDNIIRQQKLQQLKRINSSPAGFRHPRPCTSGSKPGQQVYSNNVSDNKNNNINNSNDKQQNEAQFERSKEEEDQKKSVQNFFVTNDPQIQESLQQSRPETGHSLYRNRRTHSMNIGSSIQNNQDIINYIENTKLAKFSSTQTQVQKFMGKEEQPQKQLQMMRGQRKFSARSQSYGNLQNTLFYRNDKKREQFQQYLEKQRQTFDKFMNVAYLAQKSNSVDKKQIIQNLNTMERNFNRQIQEIKLRDIKVPDNEYESVTNQNIIQNKMEDLRKKQHNINQRLLKIDYYNYFIKKN